MEPIVFGTHVAKQEEIDRYHFDYISPDEETQRYIEHCRNEYKFLLAKLHEIPPSRERSLAITDLERSLVFATKAIVVDFKARQS